MTSPPTALNPSPVWSFLIPLAAAVVGALLAITGQVLVQRLVVGAERSRIAVADARQDTAVKSIIVALLRDLYIYVLVANSRCSFDPEKWSPSLSRLLEWTGKVELAQALGPNDTVAVLHAAFVTQLAYTNLKRIGTINPLIGVQDNDEKAQRVALYVSQVRGTVYEAYTALTIVVATLVGTENLPEEPYASEMDILIDLQTRLGINRPANK